MLQKLKRLLVVGVAALSIAFAGAGIADAKWPHHPQPKDPPGYFQHTVTGAVKYFKNGHPDDPSQWVLINYAPCGSDCDQYTASITDVVGLAGTVIENGDDYAGGSSIAGATLSGSASATGEDYHSLEVYWHYVDLGKWGGFWLPIPYFEFHQGSASAVVDLYMKQLGFVKVISNGPQTDGLAFTYVKSTALLLFHGSAYAEGTPGCPQYAALELTGELSAYAHGLATVEGPYGGQAWAAGEGFTTVSFEASDSELETHWNHKIASAYLGGIIGVNQGLIAVAYVNPDGTYTRTFAMISTGDFFECGDANIIGVNSSGTVAQSAVAQNGQGAYAAGFSQATYTDSPNAVAVVCGTNRVTTTPNSVTVTSHQSAFAGGVGQPQ